MAAIDLVGGWKERRALLARQLEMLENGKMRSGTNVLDATTKQDIARLRSWIADPSTRMISRANQPRFVLEAKAVTVSPQAGRSPDGTPSPARSAILGRSMRRRSSWLRCLARSHSPDDHRDGAAIPLVSFHSLASFCASAI
jgi:hypothetical protein